ncbi:aldose epimerase family protein [Streptomyces sp. UNOC14_S4]|uniref:aldose epimerase family protein n=1 Tax=Streptomyces sp. UNOC14_S4 TaxID=2872340 RepID=UPI001E39D2A2|nr:aldose epimerase family protein [Streptomyces sp. UNOC14_S4]MCC3769509.1 galactose mutarotase [Streptomyces sp. UNOC14_S4]
MTAAVTSWSRAVGRTSAGAEPARTVHEYGLDNGRLRVAVWSYGATLVEVSVPGPAGRVPPRTNLVVRLPSLAAYERRADRAYVGSTLGRFARIVAGGRADIAGRRHRLVTGEGGHHLHGGAEGFDARVWSGRAHSGRGRGRIVLTLVSPDGDQGYPGTLRCTATFELRADDRLVVRYEAVTDRPTLYGPTLHAFWNLAGGGPVDGHVLALDADTLIEADSRFVPTGRLLPVPGSAVDLGPRGGIGGSRLDHCVALRGAAPGAVLRDPGSGRALLLRTDQPGLALYTGERLPEPRSGICLQPGAWPDAPNQPAFPSALLSPGRIHRHVTTYSLTGIGHRR